MLLRSFRTVELLRRISTSSASRYLTSPSFLQRYNGVQSYRVTTKSPFPTHISRFSYSVFVNSQNENRYTTASAPISQRRFNNRKNSRRRKAGKSPLNSPAADAVELALDSVVKIFTVSTSPSYFLPWQNKSQRESMGSGINSTQSIYFINCQIQILVFCSI